MKTKDYEMENRQLTQYIDILREKHMWIVDNKYLIKESPFKYQNEIEELRKYVKEALIFATKIKSRKGDQGGYNNKEIAADIKSKCHNISIVISHYYHPWELNEKAKERKANKREDVINELGEEAREDLNFLWKSIDDLSEMRDKCKLLCERADSKLSDDSWLFEAQTLRGEIEFMIKRCRLIYKKYRDNPEVSKMVHRKIVYECRVLDARLRRHTDPLTDFT